MSRVKILALGVLVLGSAVGSALGGSMNTTADSPSRPAWWIESPAAQNLANSSHSPFEGLTYVGLAGNLSSPGGLTLGVTSSESLQGSAPAVASSTATGQTFNGSSAAPPSSPPTAPTVADAFINFGAGPYPEASSLIAGNPQPFFTSPTFTHLFGSGGPTSADISNFENEVLATIQQTYNRAGLSIDLTTDPKALAAHTMSVVSGASWTGNANAIGITDVGHDGFSFIDKFSPATSVDQLATAIGHNLSHELMHAFGIANHPEQSGPFVDAAASTFQTLADPSTSFSPVAGQLLSTLDFQAVGTSVTAGTQNVDGNQILLSDPTPVPEPSTVVLWGLAGGLIIARRRRAAACNSVPTK